MTAVSAVDAGQPLLFLLIFLLFVDHRPVSSVSVSCWLIILGSRHLALAISISGAAVANLSRVSVVGKDTVVGKNWRNL